MAAAAPRVWAGINGNRVECVEVGCNGITVWWYDNVTPFTSGAIPDKLVRNIHILKNSLLCQSLPFCSLDPENSFFTQTMTERIPPVKVLRRCAYSEGGEVLGDIHCGAEVKAIMVCECVEDPTTTTTTTTTTFTITTTITSTTTTTSSSSTTITKTTVITTTTTPTTTTTTSSSSSSTTTTTTTTTTGI